MIDKSTLENLYFKKRLSMMQIASKLEVSHHKVVYWMGKYRIKRRGWSEATYVYSNPNGDPFRLARNLTLPELFLKGLGLGLFWGEGTKRDKFSVRLSNSDPKLIKVFLNFLRKIYKIEDRKLKFALHLFNDIDPEKALNYWSKTLNISKSKFYKTQVVRLNRKGTYKKKAEFGVITVHFQNKKLKDILTREIKEIMPS